MKLICNREAFTKAFVQAAIAVPSRTPKDILKYVFMSVEAGSLTLVGTDQENGIRCKVEDVTATERGDVLLPTSKIGDILRETTDENLEMEVVNETITIKTNSGRFRLSTESAAEYPPVPYFDAEEYHKIPSSVLRNMIRRVTIATDSESTRYALGGALLEFDIDNKATMVATDSRRLSMMTVQSTVVGSPKVIMKKTIVPSKTLHVIERTIDDKIEDVDVSVEENAVMFRSGNVTVFSRLVEGRFPAYRNVIPPRANIRIQIPVGQFYAAVRKSQIVTEKETVGVKFCFSNSLLTLQSEAASIGESSIEMPIEYDGEEITIGLFPKYLADFLKVLPQEALVEMEIVNADSPVKFNYQESYVYVIMPLTSE